MFDPKLLLDQLLGGEAANQLRNAGRQATQRIDQASGSSAFAGGAVAGGVLGLLLGSKKARKLAGGALGYGGAAVVGALAYRAYQDYRQGQSPQQTAPATPVELGDIAPKLLPHARPAADGGPFELALIRSMIAAAKADGHIDADEQRRLFTEVERLGLDAEAKAFVFDALSQPVDLAGLATAAADQEQAAELYLASRLTVDPDHPAERAYLDALAARLQLPAELRAHLDRQALG